MMWEEVVHYCCSVHRGCFTKFSSATMRTLFSRSESEHLHLVLDRDELMKIFRAFLGS